MSGLNENGQIVSYSYTEDTKKTLSFKTSAGCDSIVELDIKFGEPDPKTDIVTYCDSYNWNGTNYTASGTYTHNRTNEFKCDVTDTLKLTIQNSVKGPETPITICQAKLPYVWEGQSITKVGTYTAHLTAQNGCDSLATLIVSIESAYRDEQTVWICPNDTYLWRGQVCQQAKDYESHGTSDCGCDSAFILHIKHYPTYNLSQEKSICEGEQFILGDTVLSTTGTYTRTLSSIYGCDSIVTLKLTVYTAEVETLNETICSNETYMFDGQLLHQTGTYTMTSQTAQGCGKTTVLNLTVLPTSEKWDTVKVCQQNLPYTYCSTKQATTAGDYKEILKNSNQYGCDSTYHLHLIVNPTLETTLPAVYRCDYEGAYSHPNPAAKNMQNLTKSGIYKDTLTSITGCDSVIVLPFNWGERTYYDLHVRVCQDELPWKDPNSTNQIWRDTTYNDTITNTQQCDSVITLHFSVAKVYTTTIDTTICEMEAPYNHPDITATNLQNLTTSGIYKQRIPTVDECDSTIILNLTIWPTTYRYENIIECENNLPYTYGEHQKKAYSSGIYRDTLISKNQYGCDSVLEVYLTVLPTIRDVQYDTICDSDVPYYHLDIRATRLQNLTNSGVYYDTLKTISGCDSILELHLFVPHAYYGLTEEVELCDNDELYWNDLHLLGSWGVGDTTIVDTLHTIYGCDSVITLTVHIWPTYLFLQDTAVCQDRVHTQWEWIDDQGGSHGFYPINVAGEFVYGDTLYSIHGCDSVFGVRLTVHPSYRFDSVYSTCDNEQTTWQHKTYQFLSAGVYYDTVAFTTVDGCDSIFYLVLNVYPTYEKEVEMTLCENELPYYFTYTDSWGSNVDSIVLAPNEQFRMITETQKDTIHKTTTKVLRTIYGCDSVVHFDITIHPSYQYVERGYICWDGYYEWRGNIYNESGVYFDSLYTDTWGCDSTYVLELFVKPVELIRIDTAICDNEILSHIDTLWYTQDIWAEVPTMVWEPGMSTKPPYWDIKFLGTDGCDSIVYRYYVDIHPTYLFKTADTLCSNEFYALHNSLSVGPDTIFDPLVSGFISERDTIYIDSLVTINGCDSVYWLDAHICPHYLHVDYDTICDNESVTWREHTYSLLTAGNHTYQDVFPNLAGCDSIYELRLCVHPTFAFQTTDSMCVDEPYLWQYRTLENLSLGWHSYDTTYTSIFGCDSSFHLNLFVKDTTFEMIDDTICQGDAFDLHGVCYSAPGDYKDTTLNDWGCHHFTYLHLSVVPPTIYTLSVNNICADQLDLSFHYNYEGLPLLEYSIYFDSLGHTQGFHDVIHQPIQDTLHRLFWIDVPSGNPLPQPTPTYFDSRVGVNHYVDETKYAYPQPDIYTIRVVLHNGYCPDTLQDKDTTFTIFYPSWIHEQHWNDAIVLYSPQYNGGYEFSAQQWYYNDQPIVGQTGEYLYLPQWLNLNPDTLSESAFCPNTYKVLLTRKSDGKSVFTCPICPVQMADTIVPRLDYYAVVPTLVSHEYPVVGILSSVAGEYTVTTSAGKQIKTGTFTPDTKNYAGSISLPSVADVYHVTLSSPKLDQRTCKVIVY